MTFVQKMWWYSILLIVINLVYFGVILDQKNKQDYKDFRLRKVGAQHGEKAVCMDGSTYKYYVSEEGDPKKLLIFFEGVEWCDQDQDCAKKYGSSEGWRDDIRFKGGLLDKNVFNNRYFFDFRFVFLKSCDGFGFLGNLESPISSKNESYHIRGSEIVYTVLEELNAEYNFSSQQKIVLAGSSTGGIAAMVYSNYVLHKYLNNQADNILYTIADSSIYLDESSKHQKSKYLKRVRYFDRLIDERLFELFKDEQSPEDDGESQQQNSEQTQQLIQTKMSQDQSSEHQLIDKITNKASPNYLDLKLTQKHQLLLGQYLIRRVKSNLFVIQSYNNKEILKNIQGIDCRKQLIKQFELIEVYQCTEQQLKQVKNSQFQLKNLIIQNLQLRHSQINDQQSKNQSTLSVMLMDEPFVSIITDIHLFVREYQQRVKQFIFNANPIISINNTKIKPEDLNKINLYYHDGEIHLKYQTNDEDSLIDNQMTTQLSTKN